jgi:hypothetical protein
MMIGLAPAFGEAILAWSRRLAARPSAMPIPGNERFVAFLRLRLPPRADIAAPSS